MEVKVIWFIHWSRIESKPNPIQFNAVQRVNESIEIKNRIIQGWERFICILSMDFRKKNAATRISTALHITSMTVPSFAIMSHMRPPIQPVFPPKTRTFFISAAILSLFSLIFMKWDEREESTIVPEMKEEKVWSSRPITWFHYCLKKTVIVRSERQLLSHTNRENILFCEFGV